MSTAPKPFVLVLMPFASEFDDAYELAIRPACERAGAYAERIDKQVFTGSILERVFNQIAKADLIVADMSGKNPNVFYEVGYAHALGKTTVLLTRAATDIPFDLAHFQHIIYNNRLTELSRELEARVQWHLSNPDEHVNPTTSLCVRVNGTPLESDAVVRTKVPQQVIGFNLKLELQNKIVRTIGTERFKLGLVAPAEFTRANPMGGANCNAVALNADQTLYLYPIEFELLPEEWDTLTVAPCTDNRVITPGETHRFTLRIYKDSGVQDFEFSVLTVPGYA